MQTNKRYVLVLGSKPESLFPDVKVEKIYSANGAAERALNYKKKYPNIEHVALTGAKEFMENENVSKRIILSKPSIFNLSLIVKFLIFISLSFSSRAKDLKIVLLLE